ncbi:hypothetical protein IMSAG185_01220 [Lachnospiraceae bacterium]|nr:hypothetical protein IMSAG185_01220 [Lachnospiraceae bacterium]
MCVCISEKFGNLNGCIITEGSGKHGQPRGKIEQGKQKPAQKEILPVCQTKVKKFLRPMIQCAYFFRPGVVSPPFLCRDKVTRRMAAGRGKQAQ